MRRLVIATCCTGLALCVIALGISVYPGALQQMLCMLIGLGLIVVPLWLIAAGVVTVRARRLTGAERPRFPRRWVITTGVIVALTYATLKFYLPRRLAFHLHREPFAAHVGSAPESEYMGEPLGQRVGIYDVDAYARDPRGGVYFRTGTTTDMIDTYSWGVAYRPNDEGSPFGNADYRTHPLGGGWYWFVSNNDW